MCDGTRTTITSKLRFVNSIFGSPEDGATRRTCQLGSSVFDVVYKGVFTPVPVRVPVPFRSRSTRSCCVHTCKKLPDPFRLRACDAFTLVPERDRNAYGYTHPYPAHQVFNFGSVVISEGDGVDGFALSTETVSYRWTDTPMHDVP